MKIKPMAYMQLTLCLMGSSYLRCACCVWERDEVNPIDSAHAVHLVRDDEPLSKVQVLLVYKFGNIRMQCILCLSQRGFADCFPSRSAEVSEITGCACLETASGIPLRGGFLFDTLHRKTFDALRDSQQRVSSLQRKSLKRIYLCALHAKQRSLHCATARNLCSASFCHEAI